MRKLNFVRICKDRNRDDGPKLYTDEKLNAMIKERLDIICKDEDIWLENGLWWKTGYEPITKLTELMFDVGFLVQTRDCN